MVGRIPVGATQHCRGLFELSCEEHQKTTRGCIAFSFGVVIYYGFLGAEGSRGVGAVRMTERRRRPPSFDSISFLSPRFFFGGEGKGGREGKRAEIPCNPTSKEETPLTIRWRRAANGREELVDGLNESRWLVSLQWDPQKGLKRN